MPRLRDRLIDYYTDFYVRVAPAIEPVHIHPKIFAGMEVMYGDLLHSLSPGSRVLDVGCGTGILLHWLAQHPGIIPVGVDSSAPQIAQAQKNLPGLEISVGDGLEYLRRRRRVFSGIFCTDVLEHVPGDDLRLEWVEAAFDALQPGGFFFCRLPNAANLTGVHGRYMDLTHDRIFTTTSCLQLLEAGGFRSCRVVPLRSAHFSGRLRYALEYGLHWTVYRICGKGSEIVFTKDLCAIGYKWDSSHGQ